MKNFLIFCLYIFIPNLLFAQIVEVKDAKTGKPLEGVILISESFSTQTNQKGEASLELFTNNESILFQHSSFLKHKSTKEKIVKQGNIILLIEDPVRLDEVIVSVNRWAQSKTEIPFSIKSIDSEEVKYYNPQTTADLLGTQGGVFIQKSQMGGGSPMIRGFAANRVLIVVDGIRMNNAIFRSGNLHNVISIDANSLENTEIIFGPGSVIYGSDALGGVMSFNTIKPKLSTSDKFESSGKFFSRVSSANFEKTVHGTVNFGSKKWAGLISTTFTDFDDLKMGSVGPDEYLRPEFVVDNPFTGNDAIQQNNNFQIQKYTAYSQYNLLTRLRFRPNEKFDFSLNLNHSQTSDIPRYDRLIQYKNNELRYAQWYYGPQKWTVVSGQMQYHEKQKLYDKINLLIGFQDYTESRHDRSIQNSKLHHREENLTVFSANLDFGKYFDSKNELFYGLETYLNKIYSSGNSEDLISGEITDIAARYPDNSNYGSFAGYYSYKLNLHKQFIIQAGSRYTLTFLNGKFDPTFYNLPFSDFNASNWAFNGNVGMVWHPTQEWQINANISTGFRSPNIDDVAKVFDSEPGNVMVPNPDLKPEYARNFEVGIIRSYLNKARVEITGFYTHLKDAMVRRDFTLNGQDSILYDGTLSKVQALVNADAAQIYGCNFIFEYLFNNTLRTKNDISLAYGKDSDGFPVRHVPPTFGSSHLIFDNNRVFIDANINYSGEFDYEHLAPSEQDKPEMYAIDANGRPFSPSWWTLNLSSSFKINKKLNASAGIENILDKRYRTYSSGIVAPGRNFLASVTYLF